jgi:hypothetical protein
MSTKTVTQKLLIKPGSTVWTSHVDRRALLGALPDGAEYVDTLTAGATGIVFADDSASLRKVLDAQRSELAAVAALWVVYPKANRTDINRDKLWPILAGYGLHPNRQIAVDEVWSALGFRPDASA